MSLSKRPRGQQDGRSPHPPAELQQLLTFAELCELTQTKPATMYHLLSEGKGPESMKIGRSLRFRPAKVEEWFSKITQDRK